jgi:D-glycero-D-manno-heptose 1,7-bisphosphate phosphatase
MSKSDLKLIILDRDGTINVDRKDFVKTADEWQALPGALESIARLNQAGWHIMVVSNQSGLGRGHFDMSALNAMHDKLHSSLAKVGGKIDAIFFCPHTPDDNCNCRKPLPGMFLDIMDRTGVSAAQVHAVGDSLRDLQAADAAGCQVHLVKTGNGQTLLNKIPIDGYPASTRVHEDLSAFADYVLQLPTVD